MVAVTNVLVIGETGSGKSTFINYLANHFHNGTLKNLKIAIPTRFHLTPNENFPHRENDVKDGKSSKTVDCQQYRFDLSVDNKDISICFIDTPGLSDTGGMTQDIENVNKIFEFVEHLSDLSAILLVLNGANSRMTVNVKNVIEKFRDRIPNVISNNFITVLTNCHQYSANFNAKATGMSDMSTVFCMQNSALSSNPKHWDANTLATIQSDWKESQETIDNILRKVLAMKSIPTNTFKDMQDDRNKIRGLLHDSRLMIVQLQQLEQELSSLEHASGQYQLNAEKYSQFYRTRTVTVRVPVSVPHYNTLCACCNSVCHEHCSLKETRKVGEQVFKYCLAMGPDGRCTQCTNRCKYRCHYHDRKTIVMDQRTISDVVMDVQEKFKSAKAGKEKMDMKCETIQETKEFIELTLQKQYEQIEQSCYRIKESCIGFNVTEELFLLIRFLQQDCELLTSQGPKLKAYNFIQKLQNLCKKLEEQSPLTDNDETFYDVIDKRNEQTGPSVVKRSMSNNAESKTNTSKIKSCVVSSDQPERVSSPTSTPRSLTLKEEKYATLSNSSMNTHNDEKKKYKQTPLEEDTDDERNGDSEDSKKFGEVTNEKLVSLYKKNVKSGTNSNEECNEIRKELNRRCRGKSVGYLSSYDVPTLCEYYATYRTRNAEELYKNQSTLQHKIQDLIDDDPLNISKISNDMLLQLAAVSLVIQKLSISEDK
ncbi:unnamed protein product [Didymodactylos carnosus]|uniref:G domain-containing protein n=1 Tax=Didymodactylos carnosus TaxID=1234261 RepID=A0A813VT27_9BILA|nr:unnamed protein product [Didymodactylos carnosus]CAF0842146.1 unnamed protein product [Didymodactylos carnosus]CAF3558086.1 unnamed protein product [Didymodactylos carnosus]CAF3629478.1 unnamed protein product [Didymodactylos carnosus]